IGFGFVLGAPLTVLTSNAAGSQKGSALGTLSVARQIGLTISPTIFGMFIYRGFAKLEHIIPDKLATHNIDIDSIQSNELEKLSELSYTDIQSNIDKIPSKEMQVALQEAFNEAAHIAYVPIYLTAAVAAILIIVIAVLFSKQFKQDAQFETEKDK